MSTEVTVVKHESLSFLTKAREQIEKANNVGEVKAIRDRAEAMRIYVKQAEESLAIQNQCAEIKLRAERRAGDLLKQMAESGERATAERGRPKKATHDAALSPPSLSDLGIEPDQAARWQKEAAVPAERFEAYVAEAKDSGEEITQAGLLRIAARQSEAKRDKGAADDSSTERPSGPAAEKNLRLWGAVTRALGRLEMALYGAGVINEDGSLATEHAMRRLVSDGRSALQVPEEFVGAIDSVRRGVAALNQIVKSEYATRKEEGR